MTVILAYEWTDSEGTEHAPDDELELDPSTARNLIEIGWARPAPVQEGA